MTELVSIPEDIKDYTRHNYVYDKDLELWTPYNSPCDALLASLGLVHKLASPVIDTILDVVNRPEFFIGRPTLRKAGDIFTRVAEHRRENAIRRFLPEKMSRKTEFPYIIVDLVIDEISKAAERRKVDNRTIAVPPNERESDLAIGTLKTVSLVHRTWTRRAQMALGRSLSIAPLLGLNITREALQSPLFGPWTRELTIVNSGRGSYGDLASLLPCFVQAMPNLYTLSLRMSIRPGRQPFTKPSFLLSLGRLVFIRDLRLDLYPMNTTALSVIYEVLPNFKALKNLFLSLRFCGDHEKQTDAIDKISSCSKISLPSLRSLSILMQAPCEYMASIVKTLLLSSEALEQFHIEETPCLPRPTYSPELPFIVDSSAECLGKLDTISLVVMAEAVSWNSVVPQLIACARNVRRLQIMFACDREFVNISALFNLPAGLQELVIFMMEWDESLGSHDADVQRFITEGICPNMKRLSFGYQLVVFDVEDGLDLPTRGFEMEATALACKERKIEFLRPTHYDESRATAEWS